MIDFSYRAEFPERTMIARIYRTDQIGEGPWARTSFEFDALDEREVNAETLEAPYRSETLAPFGLVRVLTTVQKFMSVFDAEPEEGGWYRLVLTPRREALKTDMVRVPAWHAQLTPAGYAAQSRGYVTKAEYLGRDDEPPKKSVGAAVAPATAAVQAAIQATGFPAGAQASAKAIKAVLKTPKPPKGVLVHDVGQANFASLVDWNDKPFLHFDAGWPTSFNGRTAPAANTLETSIEAKPVILSHWDWDHLAGYYRFPVLRMSTWIAPVQRLGFGAARIATRLHDENRLLGVTAASSPVVTGWGVLGLCRGAAGDKNQTGLAFLTRLVGGTKLSALADPPRWALLTGDADYDRVPRRMLKAKIHALLVTHHGAEFAGAVPKAHGHRPMAVISFGKGNCYRHPRAQSLAAHKGWWLRGTGAFKGQARGQQWLL